MMPCFLLLPLQISQRKYITEIRSDGIFRMPLFAAQPSGKLAVYPNATSRVIITAKPSIAPTVAASVFFFNCDSGITSSTTT